MSDPNLLARGNASVGKIYNDVSSKMGDVMQANDPRQSSKITYGRVANMMKPSPRAASAAPTAKGSSLEGIYSGNEAMKRRMADNPDAN